MNLITKKVRSTILDNEIEMEIPENYSVANLIFDYYEIILETLPNMLQVCNIKMYLYSKDIFDNYGEYYQINKKIIDIPYDDIYIYIETINN